MTNWGAMRAYFDGEPATVTALSEIADLALEMRAAMRRGDLDRALAAVVAEGAVRRRMAPGVSTPNVITRASVREAIPITRGLSALRTAVPEPGSASTNSPLAAATSSSVPNISACASSTVVTMPMVGRAMSQSISMWPRPRAPISTTTASTSSGALANVIGTPSSLLNERTLAWVT